MSDQQPGPAAVTDLQGSEDWNPLHRAGLVFLVWVGLAVAATLFTIPRLEARWSLEARTLLDRSEIPYASLHFDGTVPVVSVTDSARQVEVERVLKEGLDFVDRVETHEVAPQGPPAPPDRILALSRSSLALGVKLRGRVSQDSDRKTACEFAAAIYGSDRVEDELRVDPSLRSRSWLEPFREILPLLLEVRGLEITIDPLTFVIDGSLPSEMALHRLQLDIKQHAAILHPLSVKLDRLRFDTGIGDDGYRLAARLEDFTSSRLPVEGTVPERERRLIHRGRLTQLGRAVLGQLGPTIQDCEACVVEVRVYPLEKVGERLEPPCHAELAEAVIAELVSAGVSPLRLRAGEANRVPDTQRNRAATPGAWTIELLISSPAN